MLLIMPEGGRRAGLAEFARLAGAVVHEADGALPALTHLERLRPDAIVCDARLEDMDGAELHGVVRSDPAFEDTVFALLGGELPASARDLALNEDATPAEVLNELRFALRGDPAREAVRGSLGHLNWDDVLGALSAGARDGTLEVSVGCSSVGAELAAGQLVRARYGLLEPEAALSALTGGMQVLLSADYTFTPG